MKNNSRWPACLVIALSLGALGCNNNNKSAGLDDEVGAEPQAQPSRDDNPFAFLWPGNWFNGDDSQEPQEAEASEPAPAPSTLGTDVETEKKGDNPFAFLWPGNWFGGDKKEVADEEEVRPVQYYEPEEEKDGNPVAFLWPGNWFKGDDEDKDKVEPVKDEDILKDMSPELHGMAETKGEYRIRKARAANIRNRQLRDDIELLLMRERPSRLSLFPVP